MNKYIFFIVLSIVMIGCSKEDIKEQEINYHTLKQGQSVTIFPGDQVLPRGDNAVIDVVHNSVTNTKTVTLISGSADLFRDSLQFE